MQGRVRIILSTFAGGCTFAGDGRLQEPTVLHALFHGEELGLVDLQELVDLLQGESSLRIRFEPEVETEPFQLYLGTLMEYHLSPDELTCLFQLQPRSK